MNMKINNNNALYYGDNLDILRKYIKNESIDLCYIDPPFNSKRTYNQIYNNIGSEDRAQSQAFIDTWTWDGHAIQGYQEILDNKENRFTKQTIELIKGLANVLGYGNLLAYLISMTLRITEIHRILKNTGSFYLHCDPTASHYLKLILDAIFCVNGGDFKNEIIWRIGWVSGYKTQKKGWIRNHDTILYYTKSDRFTFNKEYIQYPSGYIRRDGKKPTGKGFPIEDTWNCHSGDILDSIMIKSFSTEKLGYPTQKTEKLLERIINASSNEGDTILDAYCGCGTTIVAAHNLKRKWVGIDITYQSIALVLMRLEDHFHKEVLSTITLDGIPRDMASAKALANKKDDRVRKEFEKWAVMTYTRNRAIINQKKGADSGIDGIAYFRTNYTDNAKIILQVKSGGVKRSDIATLRGDMQRESAAMAIFITLEPPTDPMTKEAKMAGFYHHDLMDRDYDAIQIVTIQDIIEKGKVLDIPLSLEVLKKAQQKITTNQLQMINTGE